MGVWERGFLILALFDQQDAYLNVFRVLRGADPVVQAASAATDPLNAALVVATLLGLGVLIPIHREAFGRTLARSAPILALCGVMLVSPLWSISFTFSLKRSVVHLNTVLLALYMVSRLSFEDAMACLAQAIGLGALGSLIAGLGFHAIGVMPTPSLHGAWRGVYTHKNPLAQAMALGAVIETYLLTTGRSKRIHVVILFIELALLLRSNSVTSLLIVAVSFGLIGVYHSLRLRKTLRRAMMVLIPAGVAVVAAIFSMVPDLASKALGRDATLSGRTELWGQSVRAFQSKPLFGYGYGSFWEAYNPLAIRIWEAIEWNAPNAHNGFLEVGLDLGVLGVALTAAVVMESLVRALKLFSRPEFSMAAITAFVLIFGVLLESLTEANLGQQGDIDWFTLNLVSGLCGTLWMDSRAERFETRSFKIVHRARAAWAK